MNEKISLAGRNNISREVQVRNKKRPGTAQIIIQYFSKSLENRFPAL
jgi:hypothetical protein